MTKKPLLAIISLVVLVSRLLLPIAMRSSASSSDALRAESVSGTLGTPPAPPPTPISEPIETAGRDDIVLIAGKGHETCQIIGRQKFSFSDKKVAQQCLKKRQ